MNVFSELDRRARLHPDRTAIEDRRDGTRVTYGQLGSRARSVSAQLLARGLQAGDRVLIGVPMSIDLYIVMFGLWHAGLAGVVPDLSSLGTMRATVSAARPRGAVLAKRTMGALLLPEVLRIPTKLYIGGGGRAVVARLETEAVFESDVPPCARDDSDAALVSFTSGSTGRPKTAVRSHGLLRAQMDAVLNTVELGGANLETMPVVLLANLAAGGTSVIPAVDLRNVGTADPAAIADAVDAGSCRTMICSPAIIAALVRLHDASGRTLPSLHHVYAGGAPVFPMLLAAFAPVAPNARTISVYGSTEAEPIAHLTSYSVDDEAAMRRGNGLLVGAPVAAARVCVIASAWGEAIGPFEPAAFAALVLGPNEPGEIVVAGPHVLRGYDRGRDDAQTKVRVGTDVWHRTGDTGFLDELGRIWLLGRASAVVDCRGRRVYPLAAECAASFIPSVERSALLGIGGRAILFIQRAVDAPLPTAAIAGVDEIRSVPRIPVDRRHNAKVDYPALRKLIGA